DTEAFEAQQDEWDLPDPTDDELGEILREIYDEAAPEERAGLIGLLFDAEDLGPVADAVDYDELFETGRTTVGPVTMSDDGGTRTFEQTELVLTDLEEQFVETPPGDVADEAYRRYIEIAADDAGIDLDFETSFGNLRSYLFEPDGGSKGLVLLLHGWTGDARAMAAFVEPLREHGWTALIPDLPGHGASFGPGSDANLSALAVKEMLESRALTPDHFIGHSFGGGVAGLLAIHGVVPKQFACISSPSTLQSVTNDFCNAFALSSACVRRFQALVTRDFGFGMEEVDALKIWPERPTDILVLHAPDDAEVDFAEAERNARLPNARPEPMPGLGHREIVYHPDSVGRAVAHIDGAGSTA
ncbi:MAG: alpha/beta fold hydrolase, partial [Pseudomonadota bacterium]